jgi:hypothetical protein
VGTGVSTDVGGGYAELALSDIPLLWMVKRVRDVGLAFKADCLTPFAHFPPSVAFTPSRGETFISPNGIIMRWRQWRARRDSNFQPSDP